MYKKLLLSFLLPALVCSSLNAKITKLLAIGNSFSDDAIEANLYELAREDGDTILIANLYLSASTLETHATNAANNNASYSYRKIVNGVRTETPNYSIETADYFGA